MKSLLSCLFVILVVPSAYLQLPDDPTDELFDFIDPDENRNTCEIVKARGFGCEMHYVTTYQGYIIEIHRIINLDNSSNAHLYPVILQPGLIGTSADFIMASSNVTHDPNINGQNMGFELSKRGYDVWMTNNRGSEYAQNHVTLDPKEKPFWNFSYDQISEFDTPALIDYVLNTTDKPKVAFIGHSQGTAVFFALLSHTKKYDQIVQPFIAISPITRIGDAKTSFRILTSAFKLFLKNGGPVFSDNKLRDGITSLICNTPTIPRFICSEIFFSVCGPDYSELDKKRLGVYLAHQPTSTSAQNLLHFDQMFHTNQFKRFDYGKTENLKIYGQEQPPPYNLSQITHKSIHVIYSNNDWFVPLSGVNDLRRDLTVENEFYKITDEKSNHMDPLIGKTIAIEVNKKVFDILNSYRTRSN